MKRKLAHEKLCRLLDYNPADGVFRYKVRRGGMRVGMVAGTAHCKGYWQICVDGVVYLSHVLAVFYVTGEWPTNEVDHKDLDRQNNTWINLREATSTQNKINRRVSRLNVLGLRGVVRVKSGRYQARVGRGSCYHLGTFDTAEDAHAAVIVALQRQHGEFAGRLT